IAPELAALAERLPPGTRPLAEHAAIRRFRDEAEWKKAGGQTGALHAPGDSTDWTVVAEPDPIFRPTPLCRSIRIVPVRNLAQLSTALAPARPVLEAAGRVVESDRAAELDELLVAAGVHWIAPLGRMQRPPLSWPQGGRPRVSDWVRWTGRDIE